MNTSERFDELAQRKLDEQRFPFDATHWEEARQAIRVRRRRRIGLYIGMAALLLVGTVLLRSDDDPTGTAVKDATTEEHTVPLVPQRTAAEHTTQEQKAPTTAQKDRSLPASEVPDTGTNAVPNSPSRQTLAAQAASRTPIDDAQNSQAPNEPGRTPDPPVSTHGTSGSVHASVAMRSADDDRRGTEATSTEHPPDASATPTSRKDAERPVATTSDGPEATQEPSPTAGTPDGPTAPSQQVDLPPPSAEDPTPTLDATAPITASPQHDDAPPAAISVDPFSLPAGQDTSSIGEPPTTAVLDSLAAPQDTALMTPPAAVPLPLPSPRSPWEITALGGLLASTTHYTGDGAPGLNEMSTSATSIMFGGEIMHMGRHLGIGTGLHYATYAEQMDAEATYHTTQNWQRVYFLAEVDTTIFLVTDTVDLPEGTAYTGVVRDTTLLVLDWNMQSVVTSEQRRAARSQVNRVSYIEVPLLLDAHTVAGRWSFGVIGGPTLGLLSGRRGILPDPMNDGYMTFDDRAFRTLMLGYTARVYARFRMGEAWSIGLEPSLRGQLLSTFADEGLTRRSRAIGALLGVTYRLH